MHLTAGSHTRLRARNRVCVYIYMCARAPVCIPSSRLELVETYSIVVVLNHVTHETLHNRSTNNTWTERNKISSRIFASSRGTLNIEGLEEGDYSTASDCTVNDAIKQTHDFV